MYSGYSYELYDSPYVEFPVFHELHWAEDLVSCTHIILRYAPLYYLETR